MRMVVAITALILAISAGRVRADEPPRAQLTIDVDAVSAGATFVHRVGASRVLVGGGSAIGLSPILGTYVATGTHYAAASHVNLLELASVQLFARVELGAWVRVDAGVRGALFIHGDEDYSSGQFAGVFVAPALAWRWLWVGPRVSAGRLTEGDAQTTASAVMFDYLIVRLVKSW